MILRLIRISIYSYRVTLIVTASFL